MIRKTLFFCLTFFLSFSGMAQTADSSLYMQVDLANRWIFRGMCYTESPVIQPSFGYDKGRWNFMVWGSYPLEQHGYVEIDITAEYRVAEWMTLGITDYFGINDSLGARHSFFDFRRETTMHMFDVYTILEPFRKVPLSLLCSFWAWGCDREEETLKQNFSTYFELSYEKEIGPFTADFFAGGTTGKGFYAERPALVNVGLGLTKEFVIGNLNLPLKTEFIFNPDAQNVYLNVILTLK